MSHSHTILPTIKSVIAKMELIEGARDVFCHVRPVPIALEAKVEQELTWLETLGVISPVEGGAVNASLLCR